MEEQKKEIVDFSYSDEDKIRDILDTEIYPSNLVRIIEKIFENPRDFYILSAEELTSYEREDLKQYIDDKSCMNCTNTSCRVDVCKKKGLDEFGNQQGSNCLSWDNSELIGKQKILSIGSNNKV